MTTIKELLGQGDIKKPKRNFLQENVKRLKEMKLDKGNKLISQSNNNVQPLSERRNAQESLRRLGGSPPPNWRVGKSPPPHRRLGVGRTNTMAIEGPKEAHVIATPSEDFTPKGYRSQGCQTLNGKQLETLYYEGVIRYPSARSTGASVSVREMGLQTESESQLEVLHPPHSHDTAPAITVPTSAEIGLQWDEDNRAMTANKDFVKLNATIPDPQRLKTADSRTDPNRAPLTYQRGVVPRYVKLMKRRLLEAERDYCVCEGRYLKAHKKELEKERISRAREAADECPEGHVMLPDDIRLSHLTTLKQKYEELVGQLNQLPVSTDTLRTRNRKKQIEGELDKIEAAIALFSREKVFVKANS